MIKFVFVVSLVGSGMRYHVIFKYSLMCIRKFEDKRKNKGRGGGEATDLHVNRV